MDRVEILLMIVVAFTAARVLGRLAERFGLPGVIGELMAGAILGPQLLGFLHPNELLDALAELGVILLLFMAGLETHIRQLMAVRRSAIGVAMYGALFPFIAGVGASWALDFGLAESLFVATALMATSVGITVRVLRDLGIQGRKSVRIILASAVLDDILGLLTLVVVTAVALGRANYFEIVLLTVEAVTYILFVSLMGPWTVNKFSRLLRKLPKNLLFELGLVWMLALSLLAEYIGLAAIVGAFLAGLVMSDLKEHVELEEQYQPLAWFFVPFFFLLMGTYIDFAAFAQPMVSIATVTFTVLAIATKYYGALLGAHHEGRQISREVGVGMIPRGEVGIVVAGVALATGAIGDDVYTAVVGMVVLTTFISPFLMKVVYLKDGQLRAEPAVGSTHAHPAAVHRHGPGGAAAGGDSGRGGPAAGQAGGRGEPAAGRTGGRGGPAGGRAGTAVWPAEPGGQAMWPPETQRDRAVWPPEQHGGQTVNPAGQPDDGRDEPATGRSRTAVWPPERSGD